jgi:hypothetical protein
MTRSLPARRASKDIEYRDVHIPTGHCLKSRKRADQQRNALSARKSEKDQPRPAPYIPRYIPVLNNHVRDMTDDQCACGDPQPPNVIMPSSSGLQASSSRSGGSSSEHSPTPTPLSPGDDETGTRKGRPGSKATFPNGLRDVHEMSMSQAEASNDAAFQAAERSGECQACRSIWRCHETYP